MSELVLTIAVAACAAACGRIGFDEAGTSHGDGSVPSCEGLGWTRYDDAGTGTAADPYQLCTAAQWLDLANTPSAWGQAFELVADLDLGAIAGDHPPIGTLANPFTGSMNGSGKVISGYRNLSRRSYLGLFGYVDGGGAIRDLGIRDADILSLDLSAGAVGFLAVGIVERVATFGPSCYVRSVGYANHKGGLIGKAVAGAIVADVFSNCRLGGGGNGVAGLIGHFEGSLTNAYYEHGVEPVTGNGKVGGLIGWNLPGGMVRNTFASAAVAGDEATLDVALHIGLDSGSELGSYYDATRTVTNANASGGTRANGVAIDTASMLGYFFDPVHPPMNSWDFGLVWAARPGGYPILRFLDGKI